MLKDVTVIIPTYNEAENIGELRRRLPKGINVLIVDDSPNEDTVEAALSAGFKVVHRRDKKGLSSAVIEGLRQCETRNAIVMDADLQHPPEFVTDIVRALETHNFVIASRYVKGGNCGKWSWWRKLISRGANMLTRLLTRVKDTASGFFGVRIGDLPDLDILNDTGFKIMLELLIKGSWDSVVEIPYTFGVRKRGQTKLGLTQIFNYVGHVISLYLYRYRWIKFGIVGLLSMPLYLFLIYLLTDIVNWPYLLSVSLVVAAASTFCYLFNRIWTFRGRQPTKMSLGRFLIISAITQVLYLSLVTLFVEIVGVWYILSAAVAVLLTFPLRYILSTLFVWRTFQDPNDAGYDWYSFYHGGLIQRWWKQAIAKTVWSWIPHSSTLLNIGCGSSPIARKYPKSVNIDPNGSKLKFLKDKLPTVTVIEGSIFNIPYANESFDYVLCIEVLEHLHNPEDAIIEMARVLKPGGKIVLATPDYSRKHWLIAERFTPTKEQHIMHFTRKSLEQMCALAGLKPLQHRHIAGCDLVEAFTKSYSSEIICSNTNSKISVVKAGVQVLKRIIRPTLSRANVAVSYLCNHRCRTCNIWRCTDTSKNFTIDEFASLLKHNNLMWLSLTGGEPFLRKDISTLLRMCTEKLSVTSIVTNGSQPARIEEAVRYALRNTAGILTVNVSFEGRPAVHDAFTGRQGSWLRALETLKRLSLIHSSNLKVGIEHLISVHTRGQINYIEQLAHDLGVGVTYAFEQSAKFYDYQSSATPTELVHNIRPGANIFGAISYVFVARARSPWKGCVAGKYSCFIDPSLNVYPCMFMVPTHPVKQLRETEYRLGQLEYENIVKECEGCWTPCETYATMIFQPWRLL